MNDVLSLLLAFAVSSFALYSTLWLPYPPAQDAEGKLTPFLWLWRSVWLYGAFLVGYGMLFSLISLAFSLASVIMQILVR